MAELLFIATTIFVAYVVFEVIGKDEPKDSPHTPPPEPETPAAQATPTVAVKEIKTEPAPPAKPEAAKPVKPAKPAASKKTKAAPKKSSPPAAAETAAANTPESLKNPKTGEVSKVPGNYAFAKRWIKEALVEEGLLDKIYKNNELDAEATAKIQAALAQLKAMAKYQ